MSRSEAYQRAAEDLLEACSDPSRRAALERALLARKKVKADIAAVEEIEKSLGKGECDGILSEYRFRLAQIDREIASHDVRAVRIRDAAVEVPTIEAGDSAPYSRAEIEGILAFLGVAAADRAGRLRQLNALPRDPGVPQAVVQALIMRELARP